MAACHNLWVLSSCLRLFLRRCFLRLIYHNTCQNWILHSTITHVFGYILGFILFNYNFAASIFVTSIPVTRHSVLFPSIIACIHVCFRRYFIKKPSGKTSNSINGEKNNDENDASEAFIS